MTVFGVCEKAFFALLQSWEYQYTLMVVTCEKTFVALLDLWEYNNALMIATNEEIIPQACCPNAQVKKNPRRKYHPRACSDLFVQKKSRFAPLYS